MGEKCDRCLSVGEDRRTLWMACFYAMDELPVPFKQQDVWSVSEGAIATVPEPVKGRTTSFNADGTKTVEEWESTINGYHAHGKAQRRGFFTLRVCKRCRREWMSAIQRWFQTTPEGEDLDADEREPSAVGSGIYIREHGHTKEISREEWDRRQAATPTTQTEGGKG